MKRESLKRKTAKEYVENFPNTSKRSLAVKLYNDNASLYKDSEDARLTIRIVTGAAGVSGKESTIKTDKWIGLQMPAGDSNNYAPYVLTAKKVGLLFDIHIPYHNLQALNLAVKHMLDKGVDTIVLGGDVIDAYQLSSFERDPRERSFKYEIETARAFFAGLREVFKGRIIYLEGNHDYRVESYFKRKAPELLGIEALTLPELLKLKEYKIEFVNNKRVIRLGKLNIVHGHEFGKSVMAPVNIARGFYLRAKRNVIGGHHHQTSSHTENDIEGSITGAWSVGCLCDINPRYMPINKWNLGFAEVDVEDKEGNFRVNNYTIINGQVA